jgi:glycosyltransferase involved in cell wall biosynthesis
MCHSGTGRRSKERFGTAGKPTILTFGLLSPNKGIEVMLDALAQSCRTIRTSCSPFSARRTRT